MRVVRLGGLKNNSSHTNTGHNGSSPSSGRSSGGGGGDVELLQSKSPSVFS